MTPTRTRATPATLLPGIRSWLATPTVDTSDAAYDTEAATARYLLYGLLPSWCVPGLADWLMHRRTKIEDTAGTGESVTHSLMMAEVGAPVGLILVYEINPLTLALMLGATAAHEVTALWDVRTATRSSREVKPIEQHIHSFLESLPFAVLAPLMCLHGDQVRSLLHGGRGDPDAWRLVLRRKRLPVPYLAGVTAGVAVAVVLPYAEELVRCVRASRRRRAPWRAAEPAA